jgi:hypothetical protein
VNPCPMPTVMVAVAEYFVPLSPVVVTPRGNTCILQTNEDTDLEAPPDSNEAETGDTLQRTSVLEGREKDTDISQHMQHMMPRPQLPALLDTSMFRALLGKDVEGPARPLCCPSSCPFSVLAQLMRLSLVTCRSFFHFFKANPEPARRGKDEFMLFTPAYFI